jgi:hypothetical protein
VPLLYCLEYIRYRIDDRGDRVTTERGRSGLSLRISSWRLGVS